MSLPVFLQLFLGTYMYLLFDFHPEWHSLFIYTVPKASNTNQVYLSTLSLSQDQFRVCIKENFLWLLISIRDVCIENCMKLVTVVKEVTREIFDVIWHS